MYIISNYFNMFAMFLPKLLAYRKNITFSIQDGKYFFLISDLHTYIPYHMLTI